jgi:hypothetical protein
LERDEALRGLIAVGDVTALFEPANAARPAIEVARPQLAALRRQADAAAGAAPWRAWLPS